MGIQKSNNQQYRMDKVQIIKAPISWKGLFLLVCDTRGNSPYGISHDKLVVNQYHGSTMCGMSWHYHMNHIHVYPTPSKKFSVLRKFRKEPEAKPSIDTKIAGLTLRPRGDSHICYALHVQIQQPGYINLLVCQTQVIDNSKLFIKTSGVFPLGF